MAPRRGARCSLLEKTKAAEQRGFQLLHFWDFEVNEKFNVVSEIIRSKIGKSERIFARNCVLKLLSAAQSRAFLDDHHLMGYAGGFCHLGLLLNDEPVAVAVLGKKRFGGERCNELVRYASRGTVVGGLSRLISHFKKVDSGKLVSFADRRISVGKSYQAIGFNLLRETAPNYLWIKGSLRLSRHQTMKHRLPSLLGEKFNPALSENENMLAAGWYKISDCGNFLFVL